MKVRAGRLKKARQAGVCCGVLGEMTGARVGSAEGDAKAREDRSKQGLVYAICRIYRITMSDIRECQRGDTAQILHGNYRRVAVE